VTPATAAGRSPGAPGQPRIALVGAASALAVVSLFALLAVAIFLSAPARVTTPTWVLVFPSAGLIASVALLAFAAGSTRPPRKLEP
jgi:hypothetical protein